MEPEAEVNGEHDIIAEREPKVHTMKMWFHLGNDEVILFNFWNIRSVAGLLLACFIVSVLAFAYEALKWFRIKLQTSSERERIRWSTPINERNVERDDGEEFIKSVRSSSQQDVYAPTTTSPSGSLRPMKFPFGIIISQPSIVISRLIEVALYGTQLFLAYCLMLITMTFNAWLMLAVVSGAAVGHWLFATL
uniref:Copper transport protein n=1 Tax=Ascaris lumbricoides TaxID=6252 RepID=A0A0M3HXI3_ASCLU